jgi:hypothetical protein
VSNEAKMGSHRTARELLQMDVLEAMMITGPGSLPPAVLATWPCDSNGPVGSAVAKFVARMRNGGSHVQTQQLCSHGGRSGISGETSARCGAAASSLIQ